MKTGIATLLFTIFFLATIAQEEMTIIWEKKLDHTIIHTGTGLEGDSEYSYAANEKVMTVFDNDDGAIWWLSTGVLDVLQIRRCILI